MQILDKGTNKLIFQNYWVGLPIPFRPKLVKNLVSYTYFTTNLRDKQPSPFLAKYHFLKENSILCTVIRINIYQWILLTLLNNTFPLSDQKVRDAEQCCQPSDSDSECDSECDSDGGGEAWGCDVLGTMRRKAANAEGLYFLSSVSESLQLNSHGWPGSGQNAKIKVMTGWGQRAEASLRPDAQPDSASLGQEQGPASCTGASSSASFPSSFKVPLLPNLSPYIVFTFFVKLFPSFQHHLVFLCLDLMKKMLQVVHRKYANQIASLIILSICCVLQQQRMDIYLTSHQTFLIPREYTHQRQKSPFWKLCRGKINVEGNHPILYSLYQGTADQNWFIVVLFFG